MTTTNQLDIRALEVHAMDLEDALHYVVGAFVTATMVARTRFQEGAMNAYNRMKRLVDYLTLSIAWIICSLELIYLDIQDIIWYVHTARTFSQPRWRAIDSLPDDNHSEELFGFKIMELELLLVHLRIPMVFRMDGYVFTGEEAMLIYFHYIRTATPFTRAANHIFGGDPRRFTLYIRAMVNHLYLNFYHKISGDSMVQWLPYINQFRRAIHDKLMAGLIEERRGDGSTINWEIYYPFETFRIFGWIDDTDLQTTRPREARVTRVRDRDEIRDTQRAFYNRYFRHHGLKSQVLHLPNGMIGSIYICSLRHNDNGVQNLSGLNEYLVRILQPLYSRGGRNIFPAVYGDGIFTPLATIMRPFLSPNEEQQILNQRFSSLREDIEHKFGQLFILYQVLRAFWRHQVFFDAEHVRKLFFSCLLMSNCYTCFNESRNTVFNLRAPTIQQWLPVDENIPLAPTENTRTNLPTFR